METNQQEKNVIQPTIGNNIQLKKFSKPTTSGWWGIVNQYNEIDQVVHVFQEYEDEDYCVRYEDEGGHLNYKELEAFIKEYPINFWVGYIPEKLDKDNRNEIF